MTTPSQPDGAGSDSVVDHVRTLAQTVIERQVTKRMAEAGARIATFSGTVREIGTEVQKRQPSESLANLTTTVLGAIDAVAAYLQNTTPSVAFADLRTFSGEKPAVAAGLAAIVGFGAARVVKVAVSGNR